VIRLSRIVSSVQFTAQQNGKLKDILVHFMHEFSIEQNCINNEIELQHEPH